MRMMLAGLMTLLAAATARGAEPVTVVLDWYVNPDHGPLVVAKEKGFFTAAGLDVTLQPPSDPADSPKLVAARHALLGVSYQPQLHLQIDQGLPLVRVGTLIATPLNCLLVRQDSGIETLADLRGKRLGFSVGGVEDALLDVMLGREGLKLGDVELINVNFSLVPALMSRQVDAVIGAYRNIELVQMGLAGVPGRCFFVEEQGVPAYDELILIAHRDDRDRAEVLQFLGAVEAATSWTLNHPDEAWDVFRASAAELDDAQTAAAWKETVRRFEHTPAALERGRYRRFASFLHDRGLIGPPPPVEAYAVEPGG